MSKQRLPVNIVMPQDVKALADKIAAGWTENYGVKYSRSDVVVVAIQNLAKKEKVQA